MRISDRLRRKVIAWIVMNGERAVARSSATIDAVATALEPAENLPPFRDWVKICEGDTLEVVDDLIVVTVIDRGSEWIRQAHPACSGKGCLDCFQGGVTWHYKPGELQAFKVAS